jgi:hypothetical protein
MTHRRALSISAISLALISLLCCGGGDGSGSGPGSNEANDQAESAAAAAGRLAYPLPTIPPDAESILDRVVHIEPELFTEIPEVPRWCDRFGLQSRRIDVGGAELFVEIEGEGTPLVLLNGGPGGTHHYFHPWFGHAAQFSRVIYYDQRGCGLSDREPGEDGYSVDQAADDLEVLRRALGFDKWVVLGY